MLEELLEKLKKMPENWQRRLFFMAILTRALEGENVQPIVVGEHAVEFYTLGGYATADIDIIVTDSPAVDRILKGCGFIKEGRHWYSEELDIAIEAPSSRLAGDSSRITVVEVEGLPVYLIGIEDIIIDRLNAYVHWKSERDGEWAEEMLALHLDRIDGKYLRQKAMEEDVLNALQEMLERIGQ